MRKFHNRTRRLADRVVPDTMKERREDKAVTRARIDQQVQEFYARQGEKS